MGVALLSTAALAAAATAATPTVDFGTPPPADVSTAHLAVADGSGSKRIALWTATNARKEVCVGWRTGASTKRPAAFTCLRRGLEPPLIAVEHGGGLGGQATWGVTVGLASPRVVNATASTLYGTASSANVALRPVAGQPGWHAFTTGLAPHPTSQQVLAYGDGHVLLTQLSGALIEPPRPANGIVVVPAPNAPPSGPAWRDTASSLNAGTPDTQAFTVAVADSTVRSLLTRHPGWFQSAGSWTNCSGKPIGSVLTFGFAAPASFTATLPRVVQPSGSFSYATTVESVRAENWHGFDVWVDTTGGRVVGIDDRLPIQAGQSKSSTVPLSTVTPPQDAGPPDSGGCWQQGS